MSQYRYPQSKVIDEVNFITTENGSVRAYLHAREDAPPSALYDINCALGEKNWQCVPHSFNGKPMLEVRGFRRDTKLLEELQGKKWVEGQPTYVKDEEKKLDFKEKIKKRSLQASGWFYSLGDASFIMYGLKDSSPLDAMAGVFYGLPTPVLIAYGQNDQAQFQIKDIARKMVDHMKEHNITLPKECSLDQILADRKKGLIQSANDLMQRYPSEFMNLCYSAAGACILGAAIKHLSHGTPSPEGVAGWMKKLSAANPAATEKMAYDAAHKNMMRENYLNAGVGMTTIASGMFGTLVKEKAHDPDSPKKSGVEGMWEWIREHPLTIAGVGYMGSTLMHAASTYVAMQGADAKHKLAVPYRAAFVASALTAELLVAISSKGHGEGVVSDQSVDLSIISLAADLIVKQPQHRQDELIEAMTHFLGRPDVLAMKDEEISHLLRTEVEAHRKNPWALNNTQAAAVEKTLPAEKKSDVPPAWQARLQQEPAAPQQLQP